MCRNVISPYSRIGTTGATGLSADSTDPPLRHLALTITLNPSARFTTFALLLLLPLLLLLLVHEYALCNRIWVAR